MTHVETDSSNGPFLFFEAEHLATPFPFIARSTAHKQYHKHNQVFFCANQVNQWLSFISVYQLDKLANLHKTVNTGKVHYLDKHSDKFDDNWVQNVTSRVLRRFFHIWAVWTSFW
jgi:hypothetical protein